MILIITEWFIQYLSRIWMLQLLEIYILPVSSCSQTFLACFKIKQLCHLIHYTSTKEWFPCRHLIVGDPSVSKDSKFRLILEKNVLNLRCPCFDSWRLLSIFFCSRHFNSVQWGGRGSAAPSQRYHIRLQRTSVGNTLVWRQILLVWQLIPQEWEEHASRPSRHENTAISRYRFLECFRVDYSCEQSRVVVVYFTPASTVDSPDSTESRHPPVAVLSHSWAQRLAFFGRPRPQLIRLRECACLN